MRSVEWTVPAILDLEAIDDYWMKYSPGAAEEVVSRIEASADFLRGMPEAGPSVRRADARKWSVAKTHYFLVYRVKPTDIEILRVHHARQDWMAV